MGKDTPHTGHIDIMCPDGSLKTVNSSNQNCLFHAIVQATTNEPNIVVQQKAVELRNKVSEEVSNYYISSNYLYRTYYTVHKIVAYSV